MIPKDLEFERILRAANREGRCESELFLKKHGFATARWGPTQCRSCRGRRAGHPFFFEKPQKIRRTEPRAVKLSASLLTSLWP